MIARFVQVAPDLLTRLVGNPSLAPALLEMDGAIETAPLAEESLGVSLTAGGQGMHGLVSLTAPHRAGRSQQESQIRSHPAVPAAIGPALSLEKAWHGIHYLLCGETEAGTSFLSQAVLGGTEFGDDLGYGPARYLAPAKVSLTANELSRADLEAEMKARFDPVRMSRAGIYPRLWAPADLDWLMEEFRRLRSFFGDAGANQFAMLTCIV